MAEYADWVVLALVAVAGVGVGLCCATFYVGLGAIRQGEEDFDRGYAAGKKDGVMAERNRLSAIAEQRTREERLRRATGQGGRVNYAHLDETTEFRIDRWEPCDACGKPIGTDYWTCLSWGCFDYMCSGCGPKHDEQTHAVDWSRKLEAWTKATGYTLGLREERKVEDA